MADYVYLPEQLATIRVGEFFTLAEFCHSETAQRRGIVNIPTDMVVVENIKALCANVLDPLRRALWPVVLTSGFRNLAVNTLIGGSRSSQHVQGMAADHWVVGYSLDQVFNYIMANLPYDQLIREFPPNGWVHVSYDRHKSTQRRQTMMAVFEGGKTVYKLVA